MSVIQMLHVFLLLFLLLSWINVVLGEYHSFDGRNNNLNNDDWGAAGVAFRRIDGESETNSFSDSVDEMDDSLPNARKISNLFGKLGPISSSNDVYSQITALTHAFGLLLTFDICGASMNETDSNYAPLSIPKCDLAWDEGCNGNKTMPFYRSYYNYDSTNEFRFYFSVCLFLFLFSIFSL